MDSRTSTLLVAAFLTLSLSGCRELTIGVEKYYAGEFETSLQYLTPIVSKYANQDPISLPVVKDAKSTLADVAPKATRDYFRAWHAFAGSHFGLNHVEEGCAAARRALRPVEIYHKGGSEKQTFDPWKDDEGVKWQTEVFNLRTWVIIVPCPPES